MDHDYIAQNDIRERYLRRRLPPDELARFEDHFLDCPACLDELELGQRLRSGVRQVAEDAAATVVAGGLIAGLARSRGPYRAGLLAAAVALLVLPSALLLRERSREQDPTVRTQLQPQENLPNLTLSPERGGGGPSTRVRLDGGADFISLSLALDEVAYDDYRATLVRAGPGGDAKVWQSGALTADHNDALSLGLPTAMLAPGDWYFRVEAVVAGREPAHVAEYGLRVLPES